MIEKSLIVPAVQNFITTVQDLHPNLINDTIQEENILSSFGQLVVALNTIHVLLNQKNNVTTNSDDKSELLPQVLSKLQLDTLNNIIANIYSLIRHITANPSDNFFKELDDALQTQGKLLLHWIGDVHTQNSMEITKGIKKRQVKNVFRPTAQASRECFLPDISYDMITNSKPNAINVSKKNTKKQRKEIITYVTINIDGLKAKGVSISNLTPFDGIIHNAVCSLNAAGNEWISLGEIFRVLCGNNPKKSMNPLMKKRIAETVRKLAFTEVTINAEAEINAGILPANSGNIVDKNGTHILKGWYRGYLLPVEFLGAEINGKIIGDSMHMLRIPPLYHYAYDKNEMDSVNIGTIDTPLSNTPENIVLVDYLLERVLAAKNPNNYMPNVILCDTLYKHLCISASTENALRMKKLQIRKKVKAVFDYWKAYKVGENFFIKDYQEVKEDNTVTKYVIIW